MAKSIWISIIASLILGAILFASVDEDQMLGMMVESGLFGARAEITEEEFQEAFMDFIAEYRKSYSNSWDFENRYMIFRDNYQKIEDHNLNADFVGFTMKVNQFADLTLEEFQETYLGFRPELKKFNRFERPRSHRRAPRHHRFTEEDLDAEWDTKDWFADGKVHAVKNQGSCGSCWAFSAVGAIESAFAISHETEVPSLAEQQLVDCSKEDHEGEHNMGCNGGLMDWAFDYAEAHHMCAESDYPYTARDGTCKEDTVETTCASGPLVTGYKDLDHSMAAMKSALDEQPVAVAVDAGSLAWQFYFGGVVRGLCGTSLDHGVLAVGYGYQEKSMLFSGTNYFKIKNSWGSSWGEHGFIRLKAKDDSKGTCGVYLSASTPQVE